MTTQLEKAVSKSGNEYFRYPDVPCPKCGEPKSPAAYTCASCYGQRQITAKAVIADGQQFHSIKTAAEHYGVARTSIRHRIQSTNYPDWGYATTDRSKSPFDEGLG